MGYPNLLQHAEPLDEGVATIGPACRRVTCCRGGHDDVKGAAAVLVVKIEGSGHLDHILPLALGGRHDDDNLQLLCGTCNMRKGARDPTEFAQANGKLF